MKQHSEYCRSVHEMMMGTEFENEISCDCPEVSEKPDWKGLALGLGAHLEHLEAHCAGKTDKKGDAHAQEWRLLRQTGRELICQVKQALEADPVGISRNH